MHLPHAPQVSASARGPLAQNGRQRYCCYADKPHLPHIAPRKFFDLYDEDNISLPSPSTIPTGFPTKQWFACGECLSYPDWKATAIAGNFSMTTPMLPSVARQHRRAYFAALSYTDSLVGDVLGALDKPSSAIKETTVVALWADHGCKHNRHNMDANFHVREHWRS